jgi:hypothetical protein
LIGGASAGTLVSMEIKLVPSTSPIGFAPSDLPHTKQMAHFLRESCKIPRYNLRQEDYMEIAYKND